MVIIFTLAAISLLAFHFFLASWDGFFINLATELIGLLVGFVFLEHFFRRLEENQWREVSELVIDQVGNILRITSMYLERLFGTEAQDVLNYHRDHPEAINDDLDDPKYALYILSKVIQPNLENRIGAFGPAQWEDVGILTVTALEHIEKIFTMFGGKLNSDVFGKLIEVQRAGYKLASFADIVFKNSLHPTRQDSVLPVARFVSALVQLGEVLKQA